MLYKLIECKINEKKSKGTASAVIIKVLHTGNNKKQLEVQSPRKNMYKNTHLM
jgi:hypothetical protein